MKTLRFVNSSRNKVLFIKSAVLTYLTRHLFKSCPKITNMVLGT